MAIPANTIDAWSNDMRAFWERHAALRRDDEAAQLFLDSPTAGEVEAVRKADSRFGLAVVDGAMFALYKFGSRLDGDSPYCPHRDKPALPDAIGPESRLLLTTVLVDARTGIVKVIRVVTLANAFTRTLIDEVRAALARPPVSNAAFARVQATHDYARLSRVAVAACHGGD